MDFVPAPATASQSLRSENGWVKLVFVAGGLMLALAGYKMIDEWVNWDPNKEFREMHLEQLRSARDSPPASITFTRGDRRAVVTDAAAIVEFFDLLSKAEKIPSHHSHAVNEVTFVSSALSHAYLLGRDSSHPDEYWLEVPRLAQMTPTKTRRVVQFSSPELTAWLRKTTVGAIQE